MSKQSKIRWRESDTEKLNKEIERFNAKIYRTRSKHPELKHILPDTIKKEDKQKLIKEIETRSDFKKELNTLKRFSKKGAEKPITSMTGNTVTQWEKKEVGLRVAQLNRQRTIKRKKVEEMEATSRGKPIGLKRGEMGSERLNALRPKKFNFDKIKPGKEWEKFKESVFKQTSANAKYEKYKLYKMNYIKGMTRVFGDHGEDVIRKLKQLPADIIVDVFFKEQEASIEFIYSPYEYIAKLDIIEEIWQEEYKKNSDIVNYSNWSADEETAYNKWYENEY